MPLDIAFFGSSLVSAYWNGAATYYRGLLRALHGLGHTITFCEPDAYDRQQNRDLAEDPDYEDFFRHLTSLLRPLLPRYNQEGKSYLTIAIGCTGGRHRSEPPWRRFQFRQAD